MGREYRIMELPLVESSETPVPPEEMRIRSVDVHPYSDGRRLRISLELTPFQVSPDIDVVAKDVHGDELASASIIGAIANHMSLTLHLRKELVSNQGHLQVVLKYQEQGTVDEEEVVFTLTDSEALGGV